MAGSCFLGEGPPLCWLAAFVLKPVSVRAHSLPRTTVVRWKSCSVSLGKSLSPLLWGGPVPMPLSPLSSSSALTCLPVASVGISFLVSGCVLCFPNTKDDPSPTIRSPLTTSRAPAVSLSHLGTGRTWVLVSANWSLFWLLVKRAG